VAARANATETMDDVELAAAAADRHSALELQIVKVEVDRYSALALKMLKIVQMDRFFALALKIVKVDRYFCSWLCRCCFCFQNWEGIRENAIETMDDVGLAAAAAVNEAVCEVFDTPNPCSWTRAMAIEKMDDVDPDAAAVGESVREVFDTLIPCSSTWAMAIEKAKDGIDLADTDAAPAVDAVLVEVSYNIQTLGRSTAPCPNPTRPSRGGRHHGPSAPPSTRCGTYRYRHHHHHLRHHLHRAASPAARRSRDIATCH